jgi:hypothetical protein
LRRDGEVREQRERLARVDIQGSAVDDDHRWAEQCDREPGPRRHAAIVLRNGDDGCSRLVTIPERLPRRLRAVERRAAEEDFVPEIDENVTIERPGRREAT